MPREGMRNPAAQPSPLPTVRTIFAFDDAVSDEGSYPREPIAILKRCVAGAEATALEVPEFAESDVRLGLAEAAGFFAVRGLGAGAFATCVGACATPAPAVGFGADD